MAYQTIMINNPAYLSVDSGRVKITQNNISNYLSLEDVACIILDNQKITVTSTLLSLAAENKVVIIVVGFNHIPNGLLLSYLPHSRQNQVLKLQIKTTQHFKNLLWQGIIRQKIINQAISCEKLTGNSGKLRELAKNVSIGDVANHEAEASRKYFLLIFGENFTRNCNHYANALLNYGYSIIRSLIAKIVVASGLLPSLGIHHDNELNSFNLVDDLIEPYRGFIDWYIIEAVSINFELNVNSKRQIVDILYHKINIDNKSMTVLNSIQVMVNSVILSLRTKQVTLLLPQLPEILERSNLD